MENKRIRKIEAEMGDHIVHFVKRLIAEKKRLIDHSFIEGEFNHVLFHVTDDSTEQELLAHFNAELDRQRAEYEASDAYKLRQQENEAELEILNTEAAVLMEQLRTLDVSDYKKVLFWIKKFQPYSDRSGVTFSKREILERFTQNGYLPNANVGENFKNENEENHARWIIGQALDGIQTVGAMHQMVVIFAERWEEKFLVSQ